MSLLKSQFAGCQDPWHVNPKVPLPACTNITFIRGSYSKGPMAGKWDDQFWDRPYMGEKELAELSRNGKRCKRPCTQTYYKVDHIHTTNKGSQP